MQQIPVMERDKERELESSRGPRSEKPKEGSEQFPASDAQPDELYSREQIAHSVGLAWDKGRKKEKPKKKRLTS